MKIHRIYARDKIALRCFGDWTYLFLRFPPYPSATGGGRALSFRRCYPGARVREGQLKRRIKVTIELI